ncbi:MAG TPA: LptF/LptG family permease [Pyrinomonadaceae bacterium]|jgi:LPS export ABC transporter permease LptF/LPS export ABC transporter permease LptG
MLTGRKLIPRYILQSALPYVLLSLALLTAILFTQQTGRFAEIALYTDLPLSLAAEIAAALLPSVLILTVPVAVLAGIVIGFARMGSDSEIIAIRAAGVGTWSLLWPALLIGLLATAGTTFLHLKEAPEAARDLRRVMLQGALRKLDSPVEPRTFNTEIPGYVIYVRDGDKAQGTWGRVFIYAQQPDGSTRIVTARSGRIDSSNDRSELVLSDAVAMKIPGAGVQRDYVAERLDQLRISINTGRAALLEDLSQKELQTEELTWAELKEKTHSDSPVQRREAMRTLNRRLALSVAPLVFALLAALLGVRVRRGGRGAGVLMSIAVVVVYYLISLLGESLARNNTVSAVTGEWMATAVMLLLCLMLLLESYPRITLPKRLAKKDGAKDERDKPTQAAHTLGAGRSGFPSLLDTSLFRTLTASFVVGFVSLISIFIIFTLFELWRFIGSNHVPAAVVGKYLLYLMPLVAVELFPATMLITVLITYALLARRSEAIAWWASGQSVYRLMMPGLLFAVAAGAGAWLVQEHLMPQANVRQEALRARIRGGQPRATTGTGRQWLAVVESKRLYSYEFDEQAGVLNEPAVYELDDDAVHLRRVTTGKLGTWTTNNQLLIKDAETVSLDQMVVKRQLQPEAVLNGVESPQVFRPTVDKPSQLSVQALSSYLKAAKQRGVDVSALALALQRKYVSPFSVIVMAFIGMPLALAFGRRGAIVALCVAVGVSIAYWGIGGGFQQLGNHGLLPPEVAAWAPPVIFAAAGIYFLSRVRT